MSAISLKSITGITSITTPAGVDNQLTLHNNNTTEAVKLDIAGNLHINNQLAVAGVSTLGSGASGQVRLDYQGNQKLKTHTWGVEISGALSATNIVAGATDSTFKGASFSGAIDLNSDLDVDGHTNLDNVSIAGVTTFVGAVSGSTATFSGNLSANGLTATSFVSVGDNDTINVGSGNDLKIYHQSSDNNSYIENDTGNLIIRADAANKDITLQAADVLIFNTGGANERLRIASDGGVGINTDKTRNTKNLSIAGVTRDYTNSGTDLVDAGGIILQPTITYPSTGQAYPGIFWSGNTAALGRARAGILGVAASNHDATDLVFLTKNSGSGHGLYPSDERLRIKSNGRVGVGIDPTVRFHIKLSSRTSDFRITDSDSSSDVLRAGAQADGDGLLQLRTTGGAGPVLFDASGVSYITGGNFGVGTVSPTRSFHVKGMASGNSSNRMAIIESTGTSGSFIAFQDANTTDDSKCRVGSIGGNSLGLRGDEHKFQNGAGTDRMVIASGGNVEISDGNLVVASGHGIDFSATGNSSGSMSSELLDNYEEGTWTPTAVGFTINTTYSARYTRIGRICHINCYLNSASGSGTSTQPQIGGLPFTSKGSDTYSYGAGRIGNGGHNNAAYDITFQVQTNSTQVKLYVGDGGINEAMMSNTHVIFSTVYEVA